MNSHAEGGENGYRWLMTEPTEVVVESTAPFPKQAQSARSFLDLDDVGSEELAEILRLGRVEAPTQVLAGRGVALLFEKPSARTRHSTEVAVAQLGGHPVYVRAEEVGIDGRESAEDVARTLACYHDVICARVFDHRVLTRMAASIRGAAPVVNLLSDRSHPCQGLADLLCLQDQLGDLRGTRWAYVGDGNNVARTLGVAAGLVGATLAVATPEGFELDGAGSGSLAAVDSYHDPRAAVDGAAVVYTDAWYSMGEEAEANERRPVFRRYAVTAALLDSAAPGAGFMHCLPAHRGDEASDEVLDGPRSWIWLQAAHRLTAMRGLLWWLAERGRD